MAPPANAWAVWGGRGLGVGRIGARHFFLAAGSVCVPRAGEGAWLPRPERGLCGGRGLGVGRIGARRFFLAADSVCVPLAGEGA
jgi:hypothetical protein